MKTWFQNRQILFEEVLITRRRRRRQRKFLKWFQPNYSQTGEQRAD